MRHDVSAYVVVKKSNTSVTKVAAVPASSVGCHISRKSNTWVKPVLLKPLLQEVSFSREGLKYSKLWTKEQTRPSVGWVIQCRTGAQTYPLENSKQLCYSCVESFSRGQENNTRKEANNIRPWNTSGEEEVQSKVSAPSPHWSVLFEEPVRWSPVPGRKPQFTENQRHCQTAREGIHVLQE